MTEATLLSGAALVALALFVVILRGGSIEFQWRTLKVRVRSDK